MITVLLATAWMALWGAFSVQSAVTGLLFGILSTLLFRQLYRPRSTRWRPRRLRPLQVLALGGIFLWELIKSTLSVTREVLRPTIRINPAIIAVPLDARSDVQITALANLVSLTPGTLSLEVSSDRRTLFVHALTIDDDGTKTRHAIKTRLERPVIRAL